MVDTAKPSSMTEGAMPSAQMRSATRHLSRSAARRSGMGEPFFRKNCMTKAADSAHEHTVASPAPLMPPSSTMMNRYPSTTFAPVPTSMEPSARLGWPAVRMKLFMPNATNCRGQPAMMTVMKVARVRQHRIVGARVAQDGVERHEADDPGNDACAHEQHEAVAQHAFGHALLALAQLDGRERVAAHAHEHGHGHHGRHGGVRHRGGGQAVSPTAAPTYTASMTL